MRPERWLQAAGVGTWLATSIPTVAARLQGQLSPDRFGLWAGASATFLAAFVVLAWAPRVRRWRAAAWALLAAQAAASLAMVRISPDAVFSAAVLLVVVAGQLQSMCTSWQAVLWVAAQTACLIGVFADVTALPSAVTYGLAFGGFQLFAVGTGALAQRERSAREALAAAHAELLATRARLADHSRAAERLRIARDLHDTLGHHLTALSLQLDVATRLAAGPAVTHVEQAHAITRLLLADVREVVGHLRDRRPVDVARAVRALVADPPSGLAIHLEAPEAMPVDDDTQADALLRSVQEIVTNATRHAGAAHLWLTLAPDAGGVTLVARDDGRGAATVTWGHGLTGMRERFEALAGQIEVRTSAGRGFEVRGFLPRAGAAS